MENKKKFSRKVGDFLSGKGFYVVLFICTAVIGVSAWILLSAGSGNRLRDTASQLSPSAGRSAMASPVMGAEGEDAAMKPSVAPTASPSAVTSTAPSPSASPKKAAPKENKSAEAMAKQPTFIWPVTGDIEVVYSMDELVYNKTMSDWRTHDGIDIAAKLGTKVFAAADGTVAAVTWDDLLGTTVVIDHGNGLKSVYADLAKTPVVKTGDKVAMGAVIGAVGDTAIGESSETAHLHFAMTKDGKAVSPTDYLPKR